MSSENKNEGKPRPSLVLRDMPRAFRELVEVREDGASKYSRMNWAESIGTDDARRFIDESMDSIYRHLLAVDCGEARDTESGRLHLAHVACRALMLCEYEVDQ